MKYISWFITLPLLVLGVIFALANRQIITLSLWPLDRAVEIPLYLAVLAPLFAGYLLGGIAAWLAAGAKRRTARQEHRELQRIKTADARQDAQREKSSPVTVPPIRDRPALGQPTSG